MPLLVIIIGAIALVLYATLIIEDNSCRYYCGFFSDDDAYT